MVACAQQEPQYWGMCWLSGLVVYARPSRFDQSKLSGSSVSSMSSDGRGVVMRSFRPDSVSYTHLTLPTTPYV